jgi:hypothetical protein
VLAGCILERKLGIGFANDLGEPVDIVYLVDPEVIVGHLGTDDSTTASRDNEDTFGNADFGREWSSQDCTTADVVARTDDGRVLARIPPPLCDDQSLSLSYFSVAQPLRPGIRIINDLREPVEIVYLEEPEVVAGRLGTGLGDDREAFNFGIDLAPDATPGTTPCTTTDIVARALDGRVLARVPPPACEGGPDIGLLRFWVLPQPTGEAMSRPSGSGTN